MSGLTGKSGLTGDCVTLKPEKERERHLPT